MKIVPLDAGIEEILWQGRADESPMSVLTDVIPSETPPENYLDAILFAPTFEECILESLCPPLKHREITMPARFQEIAAEVHQSLKELADGTHDPAMTKRIEEAVALVGNHRDLTSVLNAYRKLLMQG